MSEKYLQTRIQHKHDVEANWLNATTFIPKAGEIIIYDPDATHTYSRFKIGDGVKSVIQLDFITDFLEDLLTEIQANASNATNIENGVGENAIQQKLDTVNVNFTGRNNNATTVDPTLATTFNTGANGPKSVSLNGNTMPLGSRSVAMNNKTIAKGDESLSQGYQSVALGGSSLAANEKTTAAGLASSSFGSETQALADFSTSNGKRTTASGEAAHSGGVDTEAAGYASDTSGTGNLADGDNSKSSGLNSKALGYGSFTHGNELIAKGDWQVIFGEYNLNDTNNILEVGNGFAVDKTAFNSADDLFNTIVDLRDSNGIYLYYRINDDYIVINSRDVAVSVYNDSTITKIYCVRNAISVLRDGRVKIQNSWVIDDNDVPTKGTIDRIIQPIDESLNIMIPKISTLEQDVLNNNNQISNIKTNIATLFEQQENHANQTTIEINTKIDALNTSITNDLEELSAEVDKFDGEISSLKSNDSKIDTSLEEQRYRLFLLRQDHDALYLTPGSQSFSLQHHSGIADGEQSVSLAGGVTTQSANRGVAIGAGLVSERLGFAQGEHTKAQHWASTALGGGTQTGNAYQVVSGLYNIGRDDTFFEVGNGEAYYEECPNKPSYETAISEYKYFFRDDNDGYCLVTKSSIQLPDYESAEIYTRVLNAANAFEVYTDGRAAVYSAPLNSQDVVNKLAMEDAIALSKNQIQNDVSASYVSKSMLDDLFDSGELIFNCGTSTETIS